MYLKRKLVCFVIVNFLVMSQTKTLEDDEMVVTLKKPDSSKIKGHILKTDDGNNIYSFQDIPYAEPPTGHNRFKPPIFNRGWKGVLDTTRHIKVCPQRDFLSASEDCLVLNIYSPMSPKDPNHKLPVLVWIHGGAFFLGSGSLSEFSPKYFIDQNIIVVTLNYRLGPLGFLSTADDVIPGNLGLKDQKLAMEFVYKNIMLFGGDPSRITIAGQSAGAASVGYHLLGSRQNKPFSAAILASGTALSPFSYQPNPRENAFQLGRTLDANFNSLESKDLLELFNRYTSEQIIKASAQSITNNKFLPIIESKVDFSELQTDAIDNGRFQLVPTLFGFTSEEMLTFIDSSKTAARWAGYYDNLHLFLLVSHLHIRFEDLTDAAQQLKQIYTNASFVEDLPASIRFFSDMLFTTPLIRHYQSASKYVKDVYLYQVAYELSFLPNNLPEITGVGHGSDIVLLFDYLGISRFFDNADRLASRRLVKIWSNFIKYRKPTYGKDPLLENITWSPVENPNGDITYLNLNNTLKFQQNPRNYKSVKAVLDKYIKKPISIY